MRTLALVGGACLAAGFGAGLAAAPLLRSPPPAEPPVATERARTTTGAGPERPARNQEEAVRLALAARTLEKAAQPPRLQAEPGAAQTRTPWGDTITSKEEAVTLEQLPEHVRRAVTQVAQGRALTDLTLEKRVRNGQPIFEAEFSVDGAEHELKLDEQGKIFESEVEFAISEIPTQVTGGIQAHMPGAVLLTAEREQVRDNPAFFEIHVLHGGRRWEVNVAEDGRMLRTSPR